MQYLVFSVPVTETNSTVSRYVMTTVIGVYHVCDDYRAFTAVSLT